MNKRKILIAITCLISILGITVYAEDVSEQTESVYEEELETEDEYLENFIDWNNVQVTIDTQKINFSMKGKDLLNSGWNFEAFDFSEYVIPPLNIVRFTMFNLEHDYLKANFYLVNRSNEEKPAKECSLCGLYMNEECFVSGEHEVIILDDIVYNKTTIDEINEKYGYEDFIEESNVEGYYTYTFTDGLNKKLLFDIDDVTGQVREFYYMDKNAGEEIEKGLSQEMDEDILSYEKPSSLGDKYEDYRAEINGDVYTLPIPVQVLISDGWEPYNVSGSDILTSKQEHIVQFIKDDYSFYGNIKNLNDTADFERYGWVTSVFIPVSEDGITPAKIVLPGGITNGMTEAELTSTLESLGMPAEEYDSGIVKSYFTIDYSEKNTKDYIFLCQSDTNAYIATVYTGDDGLYKKDSVAAVSVYNDPDIYSEDDLYASELSNTIDWNSMFVKIDSAKYTIPMYPDVLFGAGWGYDDSETEELIINPYEYNYIYCKNSSDEAFKAFFSFANNDSKESAPENCIINGISLSPDSYDSSKHEIALPNDIILGKSTISDAQGKYGEEDYAYESDIEGYTTYFYSDGYGKELCLDANDSTGIIETFSYTDRNTINKEINNLTVKENWEEEYQSPEELGYEYEDYRIEIEDNVYTLPVPVLALLDDGWEYAEVYDGEVLAPGQTHPVIFTKDDVSFYGIIKNIGTETDLEANCYVTFIEVPMESRSDVANLGEYYYAVAALPGGIVSGMTEEELKASLKDCGITFAQKQSNFVKSYYTEKADGDNYLQYIFLNQNDDNTYIVIVYTGTDGEYPQNTVCDIIVTSDPTTL